jgi:hypothetical protein
MTEASQKAAGGALPTDSGTRLAVRLGEWRLAAGSPSTRTIARGSGCSHTTVAMVLHGQVTPSWQILSNIVNYLGGDPAEAHALWSWHCRSVSETEAISTAVRVLALLDQSGRRRVLAYLEDRFGGEGCES